MEKELEIKNKILTEAESLFLRYGFKSITMDDVARELGVSKKTLYQYFEDKNDLVNKCVQNHLEEMNGNCELIMSQNTDPISALLSITEYMSAILRQLNPSSMYDLKKYFKTAWDRLEGNRKQYIFNSISTNLENGKKKGLYRKDLETDMVARIYVYLVGFLLDPDNYDRPNMDFKELHLEIIKYHLRAVCTAKGLELLEEKLKQIKK